MHVGENLTAEQVSWGEKLIHCSKSKVPPKGLFNTTRLQVARVLTLQHLKQNNLPTATMCSCSYCFFRYVLIASYKLFRQHWFFQGKLGELTPIHARVTWWDPRLHSDQIRRRGEENVGGAIHFNEEVTMPTFILAIGLAVLWKKVVETQTCDAQKKDKSHVWLTPSPLSSIFQAFHWFHSRFTVTLCRPTVTSELGPP